MTSNIAKSTVVANYLLRGDVCIVEVWSIMEHFHACNMESRDDL